VALAGANSRANVAGCGRPAAALVNRAAKRWGANVAGLYFDDLAIGRRFEHPIRRTVTETDNILFSALTHNPQPLHIDRHFSEATEWGQPLMNSLFTLGLMIGISVNDTTIGTIIANLGMTEVRFPHPLFQGDTVSVVTEVMAKRVSRSRPNAGIVEFEHKAFNQNGEMVAICRRQVFIHMKPDGTPAPAKDA
jgi:acyl dehydratase